jgi:hypothetical protein
MSGEMNLNTLIREMKPERNAGEYVFCTLDLKDDPLNLKPLGWFREAEGVTVILPKEQADELGLSYSFVSAWITLTIHSSLDAVGLTAVVSQSLAKAGISCNIIAGYYHDHLFVPIHEAERALVILKSISKTSDE